MAGKTGDVRITPFVDNPLEAFNGLFLTRKVSYWIDADDITTHRQRVLEVPSEIGVESLGRTGWPGGALVVVGLLHLTKFYHTRLEQNVQEILLWTRRGVPENLALPRGDGRGGWFWAVRTRPIPNSE